MSRWRIGVFDSGLGGLSVVQALFSVMPNIEVVYVADSLHAPYGPKTNEFIVERSLKIADFLMQQSVDIFVVACNTATARAIEALRNKYPNSLWVGIEPGVKPAVQLSQSHVVGVLATQATLSSERFSLLLDRYRKTADELETTFVCQVGHGWVEAVEQGLFDHEYTLSLISESVGEIESSPADVLVLGCTHYPFLKSQIQRLLKKPMLLIDTSTAVAQQTHRLLCGMKPDKLSLNLPSGEGVLEAYTTGSEEKMNFFIQTLSWSAIKTNIRPVFI
jgi:glutamate racemase